MGRCPHCGQLNPEVARFCLNCGRALGSDQESPPEETRRLVTVLFADVTGSTRMGELLDPEALRHLMGRYFRAARLAIERHGGTVEKFIGDAVMAIFGLPHVREDDALRAVRAAADLRSAVGSLSIEVREALGVEFNARIGVNTGEVVASKARDADSLVTGDAVNTAARLEQAAQPGEILIGTDTYRLVRHGVTAEPVEPMALKGKNLPVAAFRLIDVAAQAAAQVRHVDRPMVGREQELGVLTETAERVARERARQLVTIIGAPGVGKSRLVHEFLGQLSARTRVVRGRCLSYGDGLTYWPLSEALRGAAGIAEEDPPDDGRAKLAGLARGLLGAAALDRVSVAIGLAGGEAVVESSVETFWAVRLLLEAMAGEEPLVAVFDDIQWATPTFLDLLEHVAGWPDASPILLLTIARPDLLEVRPGWSSGTSSTSSTTRILVEPLDGDSVTEMLALLVGNELPDELRERLTAAAEGNPLFVEELVAGLVDDGKLERRSGEGLHIASDWGELRIPQTIELLLEARLDRLPEEERNLIQRASVVGTRFAAGHVTTLAPPGERANVTPGLLALTRKDLIRADPDPPEMGTRPDEPRFCFRHQLVRDTAYQTLPKRERARLHEAFGSWLESIAMGESPELNEITAHHLELAYQYRKALGVDGDVSSLAKRAASLLAAAARRARMIGDVTAASGALERAIALLPEGDPARWPLVAELIPVTAALGGHYEAGNLLAKTLDAELEPGMRASVIVEAIDVFFETGRSAEEVRPLVGEAMATFQAMGDDRGVSRAFDGLSQVEYFVGRLGAAAELAKQGIIHARRAGDLTAEARLRWRLGGALGEGQSTADEILADAAENIAFAQAHGLLSLEGNFLGSRAVGLAMRGEFAAAREARAAQQQRYAELGDRLGGVSVHQLDVWIAEWSGDLPTAAEELRILCEGYIAMGERGYLSSAAVRLGLMLTDLDRPEQAERWVGIGQDAGASDDVVTQVLVQAARARLLARKGLMDEAQGFAVASVARARETDYTELHALAHLALADVLRRAGRPGEALEPAREALQAWRLKGNLPMALQLERLVAELASEAEPQAYRKPDGSRRSSSG